MTCELEIIHSLRYEGAHVPEYTAIEAIQQFVQL